MEVYYMMAFETSSGKTASVRVSRATPDLPQNTAIAAMDKILAANCFDVKYGALTGKKSLKCVKITSTPIVLV
ncbi:MAG: DUF2922 domain-containing protein [Clostridiales bacterium]|nr:DUF2922 domain-containing protein [Clostridiales bacterium]